MNVNLCSWFITCLLLTQAAATVKAPLSFRWGWQNARELRKDQSLLNAKISEDERAAIVSALETQIRPYMADAGIESESQLKDAALRTRIAMIDLNSDGTPEAIAQAMVACGAGGNCPFWVFQKTPDGYQLLLDDSAETFTIQKASTNGFSDIVVSNHDSAFESGLGLYQYKDGKYREAACYHATVAVEEGGAIRRLKEPQLRACSNK